MANYLAVLRSNKLASHALTASCCLLGAYATSKVLRLALSSLLRPYLVPSDPSTCLNPPSRGEHDARRSLTYPAGVPNGWYQLCYVSDVPSSSPLEVRALGQVYAVWRDPLSGNIVAQDAFCLHLGANLAVGGKVTEDGCLRCPFHAWDFRPDGSVANVPYISKDSVGNKCVTEKKLKTHAVKVFNGLVCVWFAADDSPPSFDLPQFITDELRVGNWRSHLRWDIGFKTLSCVDWVDQAGDHSHFFTLHNVFLIPWTTSPIPKWISYFFPIGITHDLVTYRGDDKDWMERFSQPGVLNPNYAVSEKAYLYFTDVASLTWNGKRMESTKGHTLEMYCGPGLMIFHIPFNLGVVKVFVGTTPVEGGSIMRVSTWVDEQTWRSPVKSFIAWLVSGVSASQLQSDIDILSNKIRLKKPILQPFDGPYNRVNAWLKQFYTAASANVGKATCSYKNDW